MRRFFVILYLVTGVLHVPYVVAIEALLRPALPAVSWPLAIVFGLFLWWLFHGRMQLLQWDRPLSKGRAAFEEAYFVHWCALAAWPLWMVPTAAVMRLWPAAIEHVLWGGVAHWAWYHQLLVLSYPPAWLSALWAVVVRRRWVRVRVLQMPLSRLPPQFDGYRIAQLSDVHLGSMCPPQRVARWVARVNKMNVDMVALTGDYVTTGVRFHDDIAATLGGLRASDGVYAVMGNHDYFGDGQPLMDLLRAQGITLLRNQWISLHRGDDTLVVAGVDDVYTKRCDIAATLADHPADKPVLVLAHDPCSFVALAERGADLVLSGHTHWGQVALPFMAGKINYARRFTPHHAGLSRHRQAVLYVHPGLGTTGPPARLGTWPEITVMVLRRAPPGQGAGGATARGCPTTRCTAATVPPCAPPPPLRPDR